LNYYNVQSLSAAALPTQYHGWKPLSKNPGYAHRYSTLKVLFLKEAITGVFRDNVATCKLLPYCALIVEEST